MKDLNRTKKYDLSQLNDEQLTSLLYELAQKYNTPILNYSRMFLSEIIKHGNILGFYERTGEWGGCSRLGSEYVNALELFEEVKDTHDIYQRADQLMQDGKQHGLKIVVTFEKL